MFKSNRCRTQVSRAKQLTEIRDIIVVCQIVQVKIIIIINCDA